MSEKNVKRGPGDRRRQPAHLASHSPLLVPDFEFFPRIVAPEDGHTFRGLERVSKRWWREYVRRVAISTS